MIFAAGLGTRLKPLTDILPKALVPVGEKPLLQRVIERIDGKGNTIVINVHHHAQQICNFVETTRKHWQSTIRISDESDMLLETGGGIRKACPLFGNSDPILIHNCDILSNANIEQLYASASDAAATLLVSQRKTSRYLLFDDNMRLVGWTNIDTGEVKSPYDDLNPAKCQMFAFSGIHVISQQLIAEMQAWPEKFPIMDFYLSMCRKHNIRGVVKSDLKLLDVGKLDTLESAQNFINNNI